VRTKKKAIYLDTNIWNRLCDGDIEPMPFLESLKAKDACLALSQQAVYELAKTYKAKSERGRQLFQYLKSYVDVGVDVDSGFLVVHSNMEQLRSEVKAIYASASKVSPSYGPVEYKELKVAVDELAAGVVVEKAQAYLVERQLFSESSRTNPATFFVERPELRARYQQIPQEGLPAWLESTLHSGVGIELLERHLIRICSPAPYETADRLLRRPGSLMARALVRADLLANWKGATTTTTSKTVPRDLMEDMYHVTNAVYCSVYAVADGHQWHARHLLSSHTQEAVYGGTGPIDQWLLGLVDGAEPATT